VAQALAAGIARVRADNADPSDPSLITEDVIRQKLAQVMPADAVDTFVRMLNGTAVFSGEASGVDPASHLDPKTFADDPAITVTYDQARSAQRMTIQGVVTDARRKALEAKFPSALVAGLLAEIQQAARTFFEGHLQGGTLGAQPVGFLDAADFELLFGDGPVAAKQARLLSTMLPYVRLVLTRALVVQTMGRRRAGSRALSRRCSRALRC